MSTKASFSRLWVFGRRARLIWFVTQATAWLILFVGVYVVRNLDVSQFGPCEEVFEALARDAYIRRQFLPFSLIALLFDIVAFPALFWSSSGLSWIWTVAAGVISILSLVVHAFLLIAMITYPF